MAGMVVPGGKIISSPKSRVVNAGATASVLSNDRARAEIDALKKQGTHIDREFGLTEQTHAADLEARRKRGALTDSISSLFMGEFTGGDGATASPGGPAPLAPGAGGGAVVPGAGGGPPAAVGGDPADAGYARLKEREGMRLRGGINTAKRTLGRRGLSGSSFETPAISALIGDSAGRLADFDAGAMADSVGRARQIEDRDVVRGDRREEFQAGQKDNRLQMLLQLLGVSGNAY
jgi:hypothetical protein